MNKKNKYYICLILYLMPVLALASGTLFQHLSAYASQMFLKSEGNQKKLLKSNNSSKKSCILMSVFAIIFCLVLRYLFGIGRLDRGLKINNFSVIPTYTIFVYIAIALFWRKKNIQTIIKSKSKLVKQIIIICFPVIASSVLYQLMHTVIVRDIQADVYEIWSCIFIAAVVEELFFRGFLYELLIKVFSDSKIIAAVVSSAVFAVWHYNLIVLIIYNCNFEVLYNFICVFSLGLITCYLYDKSNTIITAIVFHSINNGVIIYFLRVIRAALF